MIIDNSTNKPLYEKIYKFLHANDLVKSWADLARKVKRSRTYFSMTRKAHISPSYEVWASLAEYLTEQALTTNKKSLRRWLIHYSEQVHHEMKEYQL